MKKIIIAGYGEPFKLIYESLKNDFDIVGVIKDYNRYASNGKEFDKFLNLNKIPVLGFESISKYRSSILFVVNYNKIIDVKKIKNIRALNLHIGLLPKYRGNYANAAAILNGERVVGYTIHNIIEELDAGDIYYKFKFKIKEGETYNHAKQAINKDIKNNLANIISRIISGKIEGVSQKGKKFVYASKLRAEDGIISNWRITTEEILNKFVVFAKPLGTGLRFTHKGKEYEIKKISKVSNFDRSSGIEGCVVYKTKEGSIWVKTMNTAVSINELIIQNNTIVPAEIFKIGDRLYD